LGEGPLQGVQGVAGGLFTAGVYQVGNGFRLGQVQLVIEERALGELTWACKACAPLGDMLQQQVQDHRSAVPLQFQHVFTGKGMGAGKENGYALVQYLAVAIVKRAVVSVTWAEGLFDQVFGEFGYVRPGYSHYAHAAAPGSGGNGGNSVPYQRIQVDLDQLFLTVPSRSIPRVMTY